MDNPSTVEEAQALGRAEWQEDMTWADPLRPECGSLTDLDEAYDEGRYSMWEEQAAMAALTPDTATAPNREKGA